ncbi:hypothetical protein [Streptomyces scopuliridis]|uniref:hypothetical protein n=1 Tax=Streptomyces scopuliridis TaxID=452529 RepID=UPI0035DABFB8
MTERPELRLEFQGWFMCRLATDPDPTDEPRGVSGATFALAGEPDLDRVIVLNDPPPGTVRSHAPEIGVRVTRASVNGVTRLPGMVGSRVDLLGRPRFENRNFVLTTAGQEPIVPFHLRISGGDLSLERAMVMSPEAPDASPHDLPQPLLERFGARVFRVDAPLVASGTGINAPLHNRLVRREALVIERDAPHTTPVQRAALAKRVRELDIAIADPADERLANMTAVEEFDFPLTSPPIVRGDPPDDLRVDTEAPWRVTFWMGGWDPDVLCGFLRGTLSTPVH